MTSQINDVYEVMTGFSAAQEVGWMLITWGLCSLVFGFLMTLSEVIEWENDLHR